ncbi:MAG: hypothetical protein H7831_10090 [Magnetococcus sp. WYHC-3]
MKIRSASGMLALAATMALTLVAVSPAHAEDAAAPVAAAPVAAAPVAGAPVEMMSQEQMAERMAERHAQMLEERKAHQQRMMEQMAESDKKRREMLEKTWAHGGYDPKAVGQRRAEARERAEQAMAAHGVKAPAMQAPAVQAPAAPRTLEQVREEMQTQRRQQEKMMEAQRRKMEQRMQEQRQEMAARRPAHLPPLPDWSSRQNGPVFQGPMYGYQPMDPARMMESRLESMERFLQITAEQKDAWNAYKAALLAQDEQRRESASAMMSRPYSPREWFEMQRAAAERQQSLGKAAHEAYRNLWKALGERQKPVAANLPGGCGWFAGPCA